jgi:hypothetical protein
MKKGWAMDGAVYPMDGAVYPMDREMASMYFAISTGST